MQRQRLLVVGQMVVDACVGGPPLSVDGLDCWPLFIVYYSCACVLCAAGIFILC